MSDSIHSATPVLLLPGLICDARIWAPQAIALRDRYAVQAVDGYGEADTIEAMAQSVLASAPERFVVIGHSMGGRVAMEIIRSAPGRVIALGLISTGIHPQKPGEAEGRFALLARGVEQGMDALIDAWLPPMVHEPNRLTPDLMDTLWRMCSDAGLDMFERQMRALLARPAVDELLPTIDCPTLVATGAYDAWASPAQHETIAAAISGAALQIIPDAGHMLPVEQPAAMTAVLADWLATVEARAESQ